MSRFFFQGNIINDYGVHMGDHPRMTGKGSGLHPKIKHVCHTCPWLHQYCIWHITKSARHLVPFDVHFFGNEQCFKSFQWPEPFLLQIETSLSDQHNGDELVWIVMEILTANVSILWMPYMYVFMFFAYHIYTYIYIYVLFKFMLSIYIIISTPIWKMSAICLDP